MPTCPYPHVTKFISDNRADIDTLHISDDRKCEAMIVKLAMAWEQVEDPTTSDLIDVLSWA